MLHVKQVACIVPPKHTYFPFSFHHISHCEGFSRLLGKDDRMPNIWRPHNAAVSERNLAKSEMFTSHLSDASAALRWTWPSAGPTPIAGTLPQRLPSDDSFGLRWSTPCDRSRPPLCEQSPREWCRGRCVPSPPESYGVRKIQLLFSASPGSFMS